MNDSVSMEMKINTKEDAANEVALQIINYLRNQGFESSYGEWLYPHYGAKVRTKNGTDMLEIDGKFKTTHLKIAVNGDVVWLSSYRNGSPATDITLWTIPCLEKYPHEIKIQGFQDKKTLRAVAEGMKNIIYYNGRNPVYA